MKMIEAYQMRKMYAIANQLNIVQNNQDDEFHCLVYSICGKDSVKKLTYQEASQVIDRLEQIQGKNKPVSGGMTDGQKRKVWALMYQLKEKDKTESEVLLGDRLCGIIRKELKVDSKPKNPFIWLDFKMGNKLIEILKHYVQNTKKKTG